MTANSGNSVIDTLLASSPVEVQIVEESEGELGVQLAYLLDNLKARWPDCTTKYSIPVDMA